MNRFYHSRRDLLIKLLIIVGAVFTLSVSAYDHLHHEHAHDGHQHPSSPTQAPVASPAAAKATVPIEGYFERQGIKGFGTLADAAFHERHRALFPNNGFQNQFTGYHSGTDIEFTAEADLARDVPVRAIADGEVIYVADVAGYGGLIIVRHTQPEAITSLYGHVRLSSASVKVGSRVKLGDQLAVLGSQFTAETSGARKHLHFAIHKGAALDIAGHEQDQATLQREWYDPNAWLSQHTAR